MSPATAEARERATITRGVGPWAPLGLRRNPFGEPPLEEVPGLVVGDVEKLSRWLAGQRHAVQLLGDCGRGKTAHLHAVRRDFPAAPYVYLAEGEPIPRLPEAPILFLDEAQRLPRRQRRHLFRRVEAIALATHEDLTVELQAAGLAVRSVEVGGADRRRLAAVVERRIEWARLPDAEPPRVDEAGVAWLAGHFGDDLRATLDHLYEVYQRLASGPSDIQPPRVQVSATPAGESDPPEGGTDHHGQV